MILTDTRTLYLGAMTLLLLSACKTETPPTVDVDDSGTPSFMKDTPKVDKEVVAMRETKNVSYVGIVQPAGISIYQQGSHRLSLSEGKFILLESTSVDLNGYVGEEVEIFGALRPTVEAGGMIMRVERIELQEEEVEEGDSSSESEEDTEDVEENTDEEEVIEEEEVIDEEVDAVEDSSSSAPEEEEEVDSSESSSEQVSSESDSSSSEAASSVSMSPDKEARIEAMSTQDFEASNWTVSYCTGHIGFCIPIHRNWYFRSFGTTTNAFWHVEISSEDIENMSDGPIIVELLEGASVAVDGKVQKAGASVVGYRNWTDDRHFEIRGAASLEAAITYITENLEEYDE